jgi:hypothetical protein
MTCLLHKKDVKNTFQMIFQHHHICNLTWFSCNLNTIEIQFIICNNTTVIKKQNKYKGFMIKLKKSLKFKRVCLKYFSIYEKLFFRLKYNQFMLMILNS